MDKFHRGSTVNCKRNVKNPDTQEYFDPATSIKITITDCRNGVEVDNQDMVKDATGKYHYKYNSLGTAPKGIYLVKYTAIDGVDVGVFVDQFALE